MLLGIKNKKHFRGSTQAKIYPLVIILTAALWALVNIMVLWPYGIMTLTMPPLCYYNYYVSCQWLISGA